MHLHSEKISNSTNPGVNLVVCARSSCISCEMRSARCPESCLLSTVWSCSVCVRLTRFSPRSVLDRMSVLFLRSEQAYVATPRDRATHQSSRAQHRKQPPHPPPSGDTTFTSQLTAPAPESFHTSPTTRSKAEPAPWASDSWPTCAHTL